MATDAYTEFEWRGMVYEGTEGVREVLAREKVTCYIGFDPTASSLHVGSLLPLMALARMQRFGHNPIAIAGGGTGMVGDPSGKTQERQLLSLEQIEENLVGIRRQLERFLDFDAPANPARIVNNADWLSKLELMAFLRDIGKHFTINSMLAKESVKRRIESEDGLSYTEFTYSLLQAYDFLTLFDRYQCTLQLGGSDQWGNIVAGTDLIRKLRGGKAHGLVMPLVTTASGVKFGKTEAGTVWLDAARTSPYAFYQYWLHADDRDVGTYLRWFTELDRAQIEELDAEVAARPEAREAQRTLARDITTRVHGADATERAIADSAALFSGGPLVDPGQLRSVHESAGGFTFSAEMLAAGVAVLLAEAGVLGSRGEARRMVAGGGVTVNGVRVSDPAHVPEPIAGEWLDVRIGKKRREVGRLDR